MSQLGDHLHEATQDSTLVYQGGFLQVQRDQVRLQDGTLTTREYVCHPGAAAILALLPDGRLVLERQYRHPVGRVMVEIPAGKLDPAESSLDTARRELQEETGYVAQDWQFLGRAHACIGYSNEIIDYYLATGLDLQTRRLDHGEQLDVFDLPLEQVLAMADRGELSDSKTLVGLFWLRAWLAGSAAPAAQDGSAQGVTAPQNPPPAL